MLSSFAAAVSLLLATAEPDAPATAAEPDAPATAAEAAHQHLAADDGSFRISSAELELIPGIVGGQLSVMPFLPGTSALLSPLSLTGSRGRQPASTSYLVDGVRVPSAFHLLAGPAIFPEAYAGGLSIRPFDARVTRRVSAGASVQLEAPRADHALVPGVHGAASLDLLRAGALVTYLSPDAHTDVAAGGSVAWTPWLFTRVAGGAPPSWDPARPGLRAELTDYYARASHRPGDGRTEVRLLALGSLDAASMASDTDLLGAAFSFHVVDLEASHVFGRDVVRVGAGLEFDRLGAELGGPIAQTYATLDHSAQSARASWSRRLSELVSLEVGGDVQRRDAMLTQRWDIAPPVIDGEAASDVPLQAAAQSGVGRAQLAGAYAEATLGDVNGPKWQLGVRVDDYHLEGYRDLVVVEPRASMTHRLRDSVTVYAAVGLVHEPPTFLVPLPGADVSALRFGLQESLRTNAGVTWTPAAHYRLQAQAYVDPVIRAVELSPLDRDFLQAVKATPEELESRRVNAGAAYGVELVARRELASEWFGWVSYTWQRSTREFRFPVRNDFGEPIESRSATLPVGWEQTHVVTAVAGRTLGAWQLSAAARFHTGAPEVGGLGSTTQREGFDRLRPGPKWIEADLDDAGRLPPFFRADVRVARGFTAGPVKLLASLDVQNVTFGREVTKYSYSDEADSLEDRATGRLRLVRKEGGIGVPAFPLPMLGLTARY